MRERERESGAQQVETKLEKDIGVFGPGEEREVSAARVECGREVEEYFSGRLIGR